MLPIEEVFVFDARVAERWTNGQVQIVPEDADALVEYHQRARLDTRLDWHGDDVYVTVSARELITAIEGAERARYSVQAKEVDGSRQMWGVAIEPLPA